MSSSFPILSPSGRRVSCVPCADVLVVGHAGRFPGCVGACRYGELSAAALGAARPEGPPLIGVARTRVVPGRFRLLGSWEVDADGFVLAALLDLAALGECAVVG